MSDKNQPAENQLKIEISDDVADGLYSNLAIISHSNSEFVIDYVMITPGVPKAKVRSRIILTPQHAKRLLRALNENIAKYESSYGTISETEAINTLPMNFGGPTAMA